MITQSVSRGDRRRVTGAPTIPPLNLNSHSRTNSIAPFLLNKHPPAVKTMGDYFITKIRCLRAGPGWATNIMGLNSRNNAIFGQEQNPLPFDGPWVVRPDPIPVTENLAAISPNDCYANIELLNLVINALNNNQQVLLNCTKYLVTACLFSAAKTVLLSGPLHPFTPSLML